MKYKVFINWGKYLEFKPDAVETVVAEENKKFAQIQEMKNKGYRQVIVTKEILMEILADLIVVKGFTVNGAILTEEVDGGMELKRTSEILREIRENPAHSAKFLMLGMYEIGIPCVILNDKKGKEINIGADGVFTADSEVVDSVKSGVEKAFSSRRN